MAINVETTAPADADTVARATAELTHRIKTFIGVSAAVQVHQPGGIPRSEGKAKRIIDKRE